MNESTLDRILRMAIGILLFAMVFFGPRSYWGLIGIYFIATGFIGFDPVYRAFGTSTNRPRLNP